MSNQKRLYWLKLQKDFFKSKRIKKLRRIAGGDTYTIIYLKMQLQALNTEGILTYTGVEPTFAEEVALDIDEEPDNVAVTIQFLLANGLLEPIDDGNYLLPFVLDNTGSEGSGAARMRELRARRAAANEELNVTETSQSALPDNKASHCDTDVTPACADVHFGDTDVRFGDIERERDKDIDIDIDKPSLNSIHYLSTSISAREAEDCGKNVENVDNFENDTDSENVDNFYRTGIKYPFGSQNNVLLTVEECEKLQQQFPLDYTGKIEVLSAYLAAHPEKYYESHYATLLLWDARDKAWQNKADLEGIGKTLGFADDKDLVIGLRTARELMSPLPEGLDE